VFFLIGVALFGIGLLGEYVGRIYAQVRERPRYIVQAVLEQDADPPETIATLPLSPLREAQPR
jgi:undecaprenyl-phosphate 4-deoxy-4-formamido-L-arabinose transferase